jgi:hypothetical protein
LPGSGGGATGWNQTGNSHQGRSLPGSHSSHGIEDTVGQSEKSVGALGKARHGSRILQAGLSYRIGPWPRHQVPIQQAQSLQAPPPPHQQQPQYWQGDSASTSGIPRAAPGSGEGRVGSLHGESEMARVKKYQDTVVAAAKAKGCPPRPGK